MRTVEPSSTAEVATLLREASRARHRVALRGSGTKAGWFGGGADSDVQLSTRKLNRIVAHRHADLTATIEAGATLADVNRALAVHRQWLPLDPPSADRATIGGIVATNDSGPRRHRYGAPRDLIIGVEMVRADGVEAKAGGIVVKNVAGYDLSRLLTGSFGSLAVVVSATFKLYPLPARSRTVVASFPTTTAAAAAVLDLNRSQLTPTAVEIQSLPLRLMIRFESTDASTRRQSEEAVALMHAHGSTAAVLADDEEDRAWAQHSARAWEGSGALAKVTLLPSDLGSILDLIECTKGTCVVDVTGRAGVGVLLVRADGETIAQARLFATVRERLAGRGSAVLLRASPELARAIDPWGPMGDAFAVMQAVKKSFDPLGILNPGCGPGNL